MIQSINKSFKCPNSSTFYQPIADCKFPNLILKITEANLWSWILYDCLQETSGEHMVKFHHHTKVESSWKEHIAYFIIQLSRSNKYIVRFFFGFLQINSSKTQMHLAFIYQTQPVV